MIEERHVAFIRAILIDDDDADCRAVLHVIARYVDFEIEGTDPSATMPEVPTHVGMCPPCEDLYLTLQVLSRLEAEGCLPSIDELWRDIESCVRHAGGHAAL